MCLNLNTWTSVDCRSFGSSEHINALMAIRHQIGFSVNQLCKWRDLNDPGASCQTRAIKKTVQGSTTFGTSSPSRLGRGYLVQVFLRLIDKTAIRTNGSSINSNDDLSMLLSDCDAFLSRIIVYQWKWTQWTTVTIMLWKRRCADEERWTFQPSQYLNRNCCKNLCPDLFLQWLSNTKLISIIHATWRNIIVSKCEL